MPLLDADSRPVTGAPERPDPRAWGVDAGYWDVAGQWKEVPAATLDAVLGAMGAAAPGPDIEAPLIAVDQYGPWPEMPHGRLHLESGGAVDLGALRGPSPPGPPELPLGYHRWQPAEGSTAPSRVVAVCPSRCPGPRPPRAWGWSAQLYATRSEASWGIGDFRDLSRLVQWGAAQGAGFILLNPLHAPAPGPAPEPSPYFPSSRCFLNPIYIRVEDVPGAGGLPKLSALAEKARALNSERLIDREKVWACKSEALEALFARFEDRGGHEHFDAYVARRGRVLDGYTTYSALAELHGLPWTKWPEPYRRPDNAAVTEFATAREGRSRKRYFAWLQWLAEGQLEAAAGAGGDEGPGLICDLAVGVDGGGADAWYWQDVFALGMRVGAPPDEFNTEGQDWGLAPWDPWKMRASSYEPYLEMLRAVLRPARGLRVDHVMGLFRLFWVPIGSKASEGAYVRYVWQDMVRLLRLEAWRAGAYVVGEDLGTVEDYVREVLASSGVLSYRLFWFEPKPPPAWPELAMGAVTTHDLPTVAGAWSGADIEAQRKLGLRVNEESCAALRQRIMDWGHADDGRPLPEVIEAVYGALAGAPCALLTAVLDDAAAVEERPNMPGTIQQWPNWCLALPMTLEEIEQSSLALAIARHLGGATR